MVESRRATTSRRGRTVLFLTLACMLVVTGLIVRARQPPPEREPFPERPSPTPGSASPPSCPGTAIHPGDDIVEVINGVDRETFCIAAGTYDLGSEVLEPRTGSTILGEHGSTVPYGPGFAIHAPVKIVGEGEAVVRPLGPDVELRWLDISGATGTAECKPRCGRGVDGSNAPRLTVAYVRIHHNDNNGAGGIEGGSLFDRVEVDRNGVTEFDGCCSSGLKGADQYEVRFSYIHDNHNNGVWCDAGCFEPSEPLGNGFWIHHNLIVDNWHNGVRYENSPKEPGDNPAALLANNHVHGNDRRGNGSHRGGIVVNSAQNATLKSNRFGKIVVNGVLYLPNGGAAIEFGGSRTPLENNRAIGNLLRGEAMDGCDLPGVVCTRESTEP